MAPKAQPQPQSQQVGFRIHVLYRLFFFLIEPISAVVGAYFAHFRQQEYLDLLDASSSPSSSSPDDATAIAAVPLGTSVALSQLANMYLFFALNEAAVLRATSDLRVWRTVLAVLLVADLGHLWSLRELGAGSGGSVYWDVWRWNAAGWGNVPWVYLGATMRVCFLAGVGMGESRGVRKKA